MSRNAKLFWTVAIMIPICALLLQVGFKISTSQAKSQPSGVELKVAASEFKFDPNQLSVKPGASAKVTVTNKGAIDHTWVLLDKNGTTVLTRLGIKAGQTASKDFVAPAVGSYAVICDVAGHKDSGMTGTLTVQ